MLEGPSEWLKKIYKRGRGFQFGKTRGNSTSGQGSTWTWGQRNVSQGLLRLRHGASRMLVNQIRSLLWICLCCNKSIVYKFKFVSFKMFVLMRTCSLHGRNTNEETNDYELNSRGCESGRQQTCRPFYRKPCLLLICILRGIEHDLRLLL